jgi:hypothetical protein
MIKYRDTTPSDKAQIQDWISKDPDHTGRCEPEFWLPGEEKVRQFVVQDSCGDIFYVRAENILRLHIQFAPDQRVRTARAISEFTPLIASGAKKEKYKQLIFESVFQPLIQFLEKRGFHSSPAEQVMDL